MTVEDRDIADALRTSLADWDIAPGDAGAAVRAAQSTARRHRRTRALATTVGAGSVAAALVLGIGTASFGLRSDVTVSASRPSAAVDGRLGPSGVGSPEASTPNDRTGALPRTYAYKMLATFEPGTYAGHPWVADGNQMGPDPLIQGMACQGFDGPDAIASITQSAGSTERLLVGTIAGYRTGTGDGVVPALRANGLACRWWGTPGWPKPLEWTGQGDTDHFLGEIPNVGRGPGRAGESLAIGHSAVVAAARVGDLVVYGVAYDKDRTSATTAATAMVLATERRLRASSYPPAHGRPVAGSDNDHVPTQPMTVSGPNDVDPSVLSPGLLPRDGQLPRGLTYAPPAGGWTRLTTSRSVPQRDGFVAGTGDGARWKNPPSDDVRGRVGVGDTADDRGLSDDVHSGEFRIVQAPHGQASRLLEQNIAGKGRRGFRETTVRTLAWPGQTSTGDHFLADLTLRTGGNIAPRSAVAARVVGDFVVSAHVTWSDDQGVARDTATKAVDDMVNNLRAAGKVK
ncbi:hypothetical protein [Luteipulveratus flavus]|uniref:PknH-like extracellular domain-containing protein n=1 Tax=Luteipulveratus flavus TaxID=3031728 RepID=A0ABT6C6L4_9MICO|nr:hypothetical protein [Luteipulveratus sp. YIM 133296]MDF8264480.1 hypothetical protein [Luteipulveratus sp. YIM 133296]